MFKNGLVNPMNLDVNQCTSRENKVNLCNIII